MSALREIKDAKDAIKIDRSFGYEEDKFKGSNLRNIK